MKNIVFVLLALALFGGLYLFFQNNKDVEVVQEGTYQTFADSETDIQFEYKTAPDGYVVENLSSFIRNEVEGVEVIAAYRVINEREKIELETSERGREGPPTINILVFKNNENYTAREWVDAVSQYSNIGLLIGSVNEAVSIGGKDAIQYRADGLYLSENVVVAHGDYIYHFVGFFHGEDTPIYQDFLSLIDSVEFTSSSL